MSRGFSRSVSSLASFLMLFGLIAPMAWGQEGSQGRVVVTVVDPSGSVVPGVELELQDLSTNDVRKAVTREQGNYSFVNLSLGTYKLTATKTGFETQIFNSVVAQAAQVTDVKVTLKIGVASQTVEVNESAAPLLDTTTNAIGTTIDLKQIEDLPIAGRDLTQLSRLTPGFTGTWDGLPAVAQGNNIDGVIGSPSRMKFGGNAQPVVSARLEDIQEMTVQTDQLDLNQGYGQANMQINFVTRRGTNGYHGRVFEDFRNSALNANSWFNDAAGLRKNRLILNDFGASVGGPILRDKLFFFGTFAESRQPGSSNATNLVLTPGAQSGGFTYAGSDGRTHTINVLSTANSFDHTLPGTVNPVIGAQLQAINGALQYGKVTGRSDPNISTLTWLQASPTTRYFPTARLDYNLSQKVRMNLALNQTKTVQPSVQQPLMPGPNFAKQTAGNKSDNYTAAFGVDWTISPSLVNQFKGGFLYNWTAFGYNATTPNTSDSTVAWNLPVPYPYGGNMSGQQFNLPVSNYYPVFNMSDSMTWQHGAHSFSYGFSWYREQDHYWNPPAGFPNISLGLVEGDPAVQAFTNSGANPTFPGASSAQLAEAKQLYAVLTGRISGINGQFAYNPKTGHYFNSVGAYNLDELQEAWGLFFQDSYHLKPNLTLNYGLRWDFTGDDHDLTGAYHGASPSAVFGPSGVNNVFAPGSLKGDTNPQLVASAHQYNPWNVSPQPAIGLAWNPQKTDGILGKLTGGGNTVIRAGFALRRFTEPYQYFWNNASDYGAFFFQNFYLNSNTTNQPGTFTPGKLALGNTLPGYGLAPQIYQKTAPESDYTFLNSVGVNGIDPNIKQPYTQSWNVGIQRQIGSTRAIEMRYIGSRTLHQWISLNTNEVNIFENGFLKEFKAAQNNMAINQAHGKSSFANNGYPGQQALPIFTAAFAGSAGAGAFEDSNSLTLLQTGQAGALASILSGTPSYFCNLVGASFGPCATNAGFTGPGAGYPINFFQANPLQAGSGVGYMTAAGYSNYHGLQIDLRQKQWHGLQVDANYTWSHTLGVASPNDWQGAFPQYSLRNLHQSYGPTAFDIRHVIHMNAAVDLPFGRGRQWLNRGGIVDKVVGGWTLGTIFSLQTGAPFRLTGGNSTFNDVGDGGVVFNGITLAQLQQAVGVYRVPASQNGGRSAAFVDLINPKYLVGAAGGANSTLISPNTNPGTVGAIPFLYGPHSTFDDMALTKRVPLRENLRFILQAEFLNAFNHPTFGLTGRLSPAPPVGVQDANFGVGTVSNSARTIELRANIEF